MLAWTVILHLDSQKHGVIIVEFVAYSTVELAYKTRWKYPGHLDMEIRLRDAVGIV